MKASALISLLAIEIELHGDKEVSVAVTTGYNPPDTSGAVTNAEYAAGTDRIWIEAGDEG